MHIFLIFKYEMLLLTKSNNVVTLSNIITMLLMAHANVFVSRLVLFTVPSWRFPLWYWF